MLFWDELDIFIKEHTYDINDWHNSRRVINLYLKKDKRFLWEELSYNMQEILIDFESQSKYSGLVPSNAERLVYENHI